MITIKTLLIYSLMASSGKYQVGDCFRFNPKKIKPKTTEGIPFLVTNKTDRYSIIFRYKNFGIVRFTGMYKRIDKETYKIKNKHCDHLRGK